MAHDDRRSEQFIREVDEEFRRAQIKAIWDRFAGLILGVCLLVVLITAGYRGWLWWEEREAARAGDVYLSAVEQIEAGQRAEGEAKLQELAGEGGGYGMVSRMRIAASKAEAGDKAGAMAEFDGLTNDGSVAANIRDLARLRAGLLALDQGDFAGATSRVEPLAVAGNAWRHAAREVLGLAAYEQGNFDGARQHFQAIQEDVEAPPDLRSRAGLMLTLIEGQGAAAAQPGAAPAAAAPAEAPAPATIPTPAPATTEAPAPAPAPAPQSSAEPQPPAAASNGSSSGQPVAQ